MRPRSCFRRELMGPGYDAAFIPVVMEGTRARALSFLADLDSGLINPDLPRETQIRYAATGHGVSGLELRLPVRGIVDHLHDMAIPDPELECAACRCERTEIARLSVEAG